MVSNPGRRTALLDAAIEVLAADGARGLTFRTVDARAGVPVGTASNYFAGRDDLLTQVGAHLYLRFAPDAEELERSVAGPADLDQLIAVMRAVVRRLIDRRSVYLALLELRLEATRRPALHQMLTRRVREDLEFNVTNHAASGLPGDRCTVILLYLALNGLVIEQLTLPGVLADDGTVGDLVEQIVRSATPASWGRSGSG
ncbi:TetR/AcrR family transcriptional regulator [Microlunatus speluncae]|uniref:TetR/AcrR family transcriptional regulator n=1 Tax=Microlunatus speluncae TaxID=2594267 RepID=UPI00126659E8|nr:TetR family transcriptional regulator [Microlunatus speluncae]